MSDIDPVEFGKLQGMVETTMNTTNKILEKFDTELDDHKMRITDLENHRTIMKKALKWIGSGISAVIAFVVWVTS